MGRCYDKKHKFCVADCPGKSCHAYYEEATQQCHKNCSTNNLDKLIEKTLNEFGLDATTNLHAKGIDGKTLLKISQVYRRAARRFADHGDSGDIHEQSSLLIDFLTEADGYTLQEIRWTGATALQAVETLANALPRPEAL